MRDLSKRIENLSPEKRELLELLLTQEGGSQNSSALSPDEIGEDKPSLVDLSNTIDRNQFSISPEVSFEETKGQIKQFYDLVSKQLDASPVGGHSIFLNYGYVPDENPQHSRITLPAYSLNKNCIKLALEVIGDCEVGPDCEILDVGCGRGGTICVLDRYFKPKQITGVDLSSSAVSFCQKTHTYPDTYFLEGDAEKLPFKNNSFDVIINIESSHSYADIVAFYREVSRVLRAGGYFLYTDLFPSESLDVCLKSLQKNGFSVERHQDITNNVLLSCDAVGKTHFKAFTRDNDPELMNNFLGVPGSKIYNDMKDGKATYQLFKLKRV